MITDQYFWRRRVAANAIDGCVRGHRCQLGQYPSLATIFQLHPSSSFSLVAYYSLFKRRALRSKKPLINRQASAVRRRLRIQNQAMPLTCYRGNRREITIFTDHGSRSNWVTGYRDISRINTITVLIRRFSNGGAAVAAEQLIRR